MSIEGSSTVPSQNSVTVDTTRLGKAKGSAGGPSDALSGPSAGFLAILNSFEPESLVDDASASPLVGDEPAVDLQPPVDSLLNLCLPQSLPNDLQLLLAQAAEVSVDKTNSLQAAAVDSQLPTPITPMAPMIVAPNVALDPSLAPLAKSSPSQGSLASEPVMSGSTRLPDVLTGVAVPVDLLLVQPGQGLQSRALKSKLAEGLFGVAGAMADARVPVPSASLDLVSREATLMGSLVSSGFGEGLTRPADRRGDKPSFTLAGSGAEGIWGQTSFQAGPAFETASLTTGSSTASLESMVADTVSYWVAQGVKHAALKLDGFGDQPLEVSISMRGGETHIEFRTDQPEIRQILEGATTQLKDILKNEGVVLSGVSVGGSGQNSGASQDERNRPGVRQSTVVTAKPSSADSPRPVNLPAGRVLDLFV